MEKRLNVGALYGIEATSTDDRLKNVEVRNIRSRLLLGSLKQWLEGTLVKLSKKSDIAMAVLYALGRREALMRYCDEGYLEIDDNVAERACAP